MITARILEGRLTVQTVLRQMRADAGLSQREVARRMGYPQSYVSKYETGERRLDLPQLAEVCDALDVSLEALVRRYEDAVARRDQMVP